MLLLLLSPICSAKCVEVNDGLFIPGAGRQYVEPCETFWSFLGLLGSTTQVRVCLG